MPRFPDTISQFLDDAAGDSSDEEDWSDEEGEGEDTDGSRVGAGSSSSIPLPRRNPVLPERLITETDEDLAQFYQNLATQSSGRSTLTSIGDQRRTVASVVDALPHVGDAFMFCVPCKTRQEQELVFRLVRKSYADGIGGVSSVFCVPKSPGRLYFEADSPAAVRRLCRGMLYIYSRSLFVVPITERVALLERGKVNPTLEVGDWVKIRNGPYRGDIGPIFSPEDEDQCLVVKVKSREKHHTTSELRHITTAPLEYVGDAERRKRKRTEARVEPYVLPKHPFDPRLLDGTSIKLTNDGFKLRGKQYSQDGYRLLRLRADRVELTTSGAAERDAFSQYEAAVALNQTSGSSSFTPSTSTVSAPLFLNVGNRVFITQGPAEGRRGTIQRLTADRAVVSLDDDLGQDNDDPKPPFIHAEVENGHLTREFEVGEVVEVMVGSNTGKSGMVVEIRPKTLVFLDEKDRKVYEVPSMYVDSPFTKHVDSSLDVGLKLDMFVIITGGKHSGKQGVVTDIKTWVVTIVEEGSGVKMNVAKQNVKRHPADEERKELALVEEIRNKAEYSTMKARRDAFKDFASAIGMDLDLYSVKCGEHTYIPFRLKTFDECLEKYEPWNRMLSREERINAFWNYCGTFDVDCPKLVEIAALEEAEATNKSHDTASDEDNTDDQVDPFAPEQVKADMDVTMSGLSRRLRLAFLKFTRARYIGIGVDGVDRPPVELTDIQEQIVWESALTELAADLGITVTFVDSREEELEDQTEDADNPTCFLNHRDQGFEGKEVYVWDGMYKGKLGRVKRMNGERCQVEIETAIFNNGLTVIEGRFLVARCGCTLGNGAKPKWRKDPVKVASMFDRTTDHHPSALRPSTPPRGSRSNESIEEPQFHDSTAEGMWLFEPRIAELRKSNKLVIKIELHPDSDVAGRREGKILTEEAPHTLPLPRSVPAAVKVEYAVKKKNEMRTETLPVHTLRVTAPKVKKRHVVIKGERVGEIVIYLRSDGLSGQVHKEGTRSDVFYVPKAELCLLDPL